MLGKLNETEIRNILSSQAIGRLACTDGKQPYISPVTYVYDGDYIYGQSNIGTKLEMMRKNPNVCFEVDLIMDMRNWQSVLVYGKFEELKTKKADEAREKMFGRLFPMATSSTIHPHQHSVEGKVDDPNRVKLVMYRIKIKKTTGRFEKQ